MFISAGITPPRAAVRGSKFSQDVDGCKSTGDRTRAGFKFADLNSSRVALLCCQMKAEQTELERQLWRVRRDIQRKHEEKVKAARTK